MGQVTNIINKVYSTYSSLIFWSMKKKENKNLFFSSSLYLIINPKVCQQNNIIFIWYKIKICK